MMAIFSIAKKYPRLVFAISTIIACATVAFSIELTEKLNLHPCALCIFQRLLFMAIGLIAFLGLLLPQIRFLWGGLMLLLSGGGFATAVYQSWIQVFPESATCGLSGAPDMIERFVDGVALRMIDWLGSDWGGTFFPTGTCTSKEWVFLSLSIANWSAIGFLFFMVIALLLLKRR